MNFDNLTNISKAIARDRYDEPLRCHHTAFILKRNKIITIGLNVKKTHPLNLRYKYCPLKGGTCAELSAVMKTLGAIDHRKHIMVVTRVDRNGLLNNSKPCKGCQQLVAQLEFKEVWYSIQGETYERL